VGEYGAGGEGLKSSTDGGILACGDRATIEMAGSRRAAKSRTGLPAYLAVFLAAAHSLTQISVGCIKRAVVVMRSSYRGNCRVDAMQIARVHVRMRLSRAYQPSPIGSSVRHRSPLTFYMRRSTCGKLSAPRRLFAERNRESASDLTCKKSDTTGPHDPRDVDVEAPTAPATRGIHKYRNTFLSSLLSSPLPPPPPPSPSPPVPASLDFHTAAARAVAEFYSALCSANDRQARSGRDFRRERRNRKSFYVKLFCSAAALQRQILTIRARDYSESHPVRERCQDLRILRIRGQQIRCSLQTRRYCAHTIPSFYKLFLCFWHARDGGK